MRRAGITVTVAAAMLALLGVPTGFSQVAKSKDLDKQHDEMLRDFASRAHKLALQYEQSGAHDKARSTLNLILQVLPDDAAAKVLLDKINKQELSENKRSIKVMANQSWQKTGVTVIEGKPLVIEANGTWVFRMNRQVSPDGLDLPEDMKRFPLGALIGYIDSESPASPAGKDRKKERPFLIGSQKMFTPDATGVLYLKMHDSDPTDNAGQISVTISGQVR